MEEMEKDALILSWGVDPRQADIFSFGNFEFRGPTTNQKKGYLETIPGLCSMDGRME
jgi:hypothetical protein